MMCNILGHIKECSSSADATPYLIKERATRKMVCERPNSECRHCKGVYRTLYTQWGNVLKGVFDRGNSPPPSI
ncbi:hypothetical protein GDO78_001973 [Eleutherodactylus coqui]|uniref:Uncharacterized protein n=1 Tax=Eleutherodactylus coqui TaxID=57060 RepID=A0A8J6KJQ4_ELECQ|nr:hypothetical protein GDO78_001973 [Eleutherodactylus coqui]